MKATKILVICIICLFVTLIARTQEPNSLAYPEEGKPMPECLIQHIKYYPVRQAQLADFLGKWLLLDFWNVNCGACVLSFPRINEIQQQLGDRVQVMMVGIQDKQNRIQPMYAKFKEREHLVMPCAFDSALATRFDIYTAPHSILIDDRGIVRCVTTSFNVDDIRAFLRGHPPVMPKTYRRMNDDAPVVGTRYTFDANKPYLVNSNGGQETAFIFRSIFSAWSGAMQDVYFPSSISQDLLKGQFQVLGTPLEWLFNFEHFGRGIWNFEDTIFYKVYNHAILEVHDSSKFKYSYKYNRNLYAYSLVFPKEMATESYVRSVLKKDLSAYWGLESTIETRDCAVWVLKASDLARQTLKTRGGPEQQNQIISHASFMARDSPFSKLLAWIRINQSDKIIFDDTGITGNIDITMDCIPTDIDDLISGLRKNGIELIKTTKPMRVVVIKDAKGKF